MVRAFMASSVEPVLVESANSLSWRQAHAFRLRRHHLAQRAPRSALPRVVRDIGGVQAQFLPFARLALWARVSNLRRDDVDRALWKDRTLVRTWAMRGTIHLLASEDLPWFVAAISRRLMRHTDRYLGRQGLTTEEAEVFTEAVLEALQAGALTRNALATKIVAIHGERAKSWIEHAWGGIVGRACLAGKVCYGPNEGQEITFVRRDRWLRSWRDMSTADAQAIAVQTYLRAYGPAASSDVSAWSGLSAKDLTPGFERLAAELAKVEISGRSCLALREDLSVLRRGGTDGRLVRLLPNYDVYILGHRDKAHLVEVSHYKRVFRKAGWISATVLLDGRVEGVWSHHVRGERLSVLVEPFARLSPGVRRAVEEEVADLGRFLETRAVDVKFT